MLNLSTSSWAQGGITLAAGGGFIVPGVGAYLITAHVLLDAASAAGRFDLIFGNLTQEGIAAGSGMSDGSYASGGGSIWNHAAGQYMSMTHSSIVKATAINDVLGVAAYNRSGGAGSIYGGGWSSAEIARVSA